MKTNMKTFTEVKKVLSEREDQIKTLDKSNEEITSLCRTLLDCVRQSLRNRTDGLTYDEKQELSKTTNDLHHKIDNIEIPVIPVEIHKVDDDITTI
mgnify:CR=1 FL=1